MGVWIAFLRWFVIHWSACPDLAWALYFLFALNMWALYLLFVLGMWALYLLFALGMWALYLLFTPSVTPILCCRCEQN